MFCVISEPRNRAAENAGNKHPKRDSTRKDADSGAAPLDWSKVYSHWKQYLDSCERTQSGLVNAYTSGATDDKPRKKQRIMKEVKFGLRAMAMQISKLANERERISGRRGRRSASGVTKRMAVA